MNSPIPFDRYDKVRSQRLRAEAEPSFLLGGAEDPVRWEIIGVASSGDSAIMVLGRVREGLTAGDLNAR